LDTPKKKRLGSNELKETNHPMGYVTHRIVFLIVMTGIIAWLFGGCSSIGPHSIKTGRAVYNQAINQTEDQQLLVTIVQYRYGETTSMLVVKSVTANIRVSTKAEIQFGIGPESYYAGNLVPLGGAILYEENPTISYVPVQGAKYIRHLMSPIPLEVMFLLGSSMGSKQLAFLLLIRSINNINNPDFISNPSDDSPTRFMRAAEMLTDLRFTGRLVYGITSRKEGQYSIPIRNYAPERLEEVRELMSLLYLPMPEDTS
jgi:hypothetical protein